jgi:serine/threonine protein kinase
MAGNIFISYSRKDVDFVIRLSEDLALHGYKTWIDSSSIQVGEIWREKVVQAIEGCKFFLLILSPNSINSINVVKELSLAEGSNKIIFPIIIEKTIIPSSMRYQLAGVQFIFLSSVNGCLNIDSLVKSMERNLAEPDQTFPFSLLSEKNYMINRCLNQSNKKSSFLVQDLERGGYAVLKIFPSNAECDHFYESEAKTIEKINNVGTPRLLDYFACRGYYCLVFEFIDSTPWCRLNIDCNSIIPIVKQALGILASIHQKGMIHGDINPNNLLLSTDYQRVSIVDYELIKCRLFIQNKLKNSRFQDDIDCFSGVDNRTKTNDKLFWAPECVSLSRLSTSIDLYSLGASILSVSSGIPAESLYDTRLRRWRIEFCDQTLYPWLSLMLKESPSERLQSAEQVLNLIDSKSIRVLSLPFKNCAVYNSEAETSIDQIDGNLSIAHSIPFSVQLQSTAPSVPDIENKFWSRQLLQENLSIRIGPITSVLLNGYPEKLTQIDCNRLRDQLLQNALDLETINEVFTQSEQSVVPAKLLQFGDHDDYSIKSYPIVESVVQSQSSPLLESSSVKSPSDALNDFHQREQKIYTILVEAIGPIANLLLREVEGIESYKKKIALILARLQEYGVDQDVIHRIAERARSNTL